MLSDCIEEYVAGAQDWSTRIAEGPYTADKLAQDMENMWARVLRKGASGVDLGARGTRAGARMRTRDRSGG
jgi:hypothetical protein